MTLSQVLKNGLLFRVSTRDDKHIKIWFMDDTIYYRILKHLKSPKSLKAKKPTGASDRRFSLHRVTDNLPVPPTCTPSPLYLSVCVVVVCPAYFGDDITNVYTRLGLRRRPHRTHVTLGSEQSQLEFEQSDIISVPLSDIVDVEAGKVRPFHHETDAPHRPF